MYYHMVMFLFSNIIGFQQTSLRFQHLNVDHGLPQISVLCSLQDERGFWWFGTQDGLCRYDGYDVQVFKNDPNQPKSISDNFIHAIVEDQEGRLWIGTGNGLNLFHPETMNFSHFQHNGAVADSLPSNVVRAMAVDNEGTLWLGTEGAGLCRMALDRPGVFTNPFKGAISQTTDAQNIWTVYCGEDGVVWAGGDDGLARFSENEVIHYRHDGSHPKSISDNTIWAITGGRDFLWIGTKGGGLNYFDGNHFTRYGEADGLRSNSVRSLFLDRSQQLWVGTWGGGLSRFRNGKFDTWQQQSHDPKGLSHNVIWSITEDRSGLLLVGTDGGGLNIFNLFNQSFEHYKHNPNNENSLGHHVIWSLYEDRQEHLWIGTYDGLDLWEPKAKTFRHFKHNPEDKQSIGPGSVRAILEDRDRRLWVGTFGSGLHLLDRQTGHFSKIPFPQNDGTLTSHFDIRALCEDDAGHLWIGTWGKGLWRYDGTYFRVYHHIPGEHQSLSHDRILTLLADGNTLWIGTDGGGLNRLEIHTGRIRQYTVDDGLSHQRIRAIHKTNEHGLWLGTDGGGLNFIDLTSGKIQVIREGLPNNVIYTILEDRELLWLSTNNGLSCFDPKTRVFKNYNRNHGLQHNEFDQGAAFKGKEFLYFGGINGFNRFQPNQIRQNTQPPTPIFTRYSVNGQYRSFIPGTQQLLFDLKTKLISFQFSALDFVNPKNNRYQYKMADGDTWFDLEETHSLTLSMLPSGTYDLEVRAQNTDGIFSENNAKLTITMPPPMWKTKPFMALMVFLSFAIFLFCFNLYRRRNRRKHKAAVLSLELDQKRKELDFARQVQLSMLPTAGVSKDRYDILGRMRTATEVGGDYYDYFAINDHQTLIIWGDATGHGMTAGLIVAMARASLLHALPSFKDLPIHEVLKQVNRTLKKSITQKNIGMSLGIAVFDEDDFSVALSYGGMPAPLHYRSLNDDIHKCEIKCPPLGFLREIPASSLFIHLEPGDALIFSSDGLIERSNPEGELWGLKAFETAFHRACQEQPNSNHIIRRIFAACDYFGGNFENDDDLTLVVLTRKKED